jgi:predicted adenine nucleotide alpha hydrolase (AANH) superfamily ATPase
LELKTIEEKLFDPSFEKYCGHYADKYWFYHVHIKNNRLYLDQFWKNLKLRPLSEDEFEIIEVPNHDVTILDYFKVHTGDRDQERVNRCVNCPDIELEARDKFAKFLI